MKKSWGDILHELGLAVLWFVTGYIFSALIFGWGTQAALNGALINMVVGLVLIVFINMHERVARLLYRVENGQDLGPPRILLMLLILVPYLCVVCGLCYWVLRALGLWR